MTQFGTILSNSQIVTLAVSKLGGATKAVDIEDIAILAYEIYPEKFSWRKYPERIDLRVVQYALKDASSVHKGEPLLKGNLKHGYILTPTGLDWAEKNQHVSFEDYKAGSRKQSTTDKLSIEQARLLKSSAFVKFEANRVKDIKYSDFQEFARVNDYFPEHVRQKRYVIVQNAVSGNRKLEALWELLVAEFVEEKLK
ncbi:MAG: hypothetical protein HND44_01055 [Chloroflexi bacterium]|nr:hypothetical protein [Ardenticatenaceae bacterium]MBL1127088.1 hypothetical protein [Chloroflexota bacterium]NOG33149.1 hypothetical protein [Chloroflexota bacterium]GIK54943.1 MAG: hypothetical protein BroJett015_06060 [Chloroflexota bacterium]